MTKTKAGYVDKSPDHRPPCATCEHYDALAGVCAVVAGFIRAWATCDHWHGRPAA